MLSNIGNVGALAVSKAVASAYYNTGNIVANTTYTSPQVDVAGMPMVGVLLAQTSGAGPVTARLQVAFRKDQTGSPVWIQAGPNFLLPVLNQGVPVSVALGVQALRVQIENPAGSPTAQVTIAVFGTG